MLTIAIIIAVIYALALVFVKLLAGLAPEGYQDDNGYHNGKQP